MLSVDPVEEKATITLASVLISRRTEEASRKYQLDYVVDVIIYNTPPPTNPDVRSPNRKQTLDDRLNAMLAAFDARSLWCFSSCRCVMFDLLSTDLISIPPFSTCTFPSQRAVHRRATSLCQQFQALIAGLTTTRWQTPTR